MALDWTPIHLTDPVLHQAAFVGDQKSVQVLLCNKVHGASINVRNRLGCTPLRLAATGGHTECVRCLIKAGAIIDLADVKAQTPLYVAIKNKHVHCAKALLEAGANPNGDNNSLCTPLYIAAMDGFADGVRILLQYNADIDRCHVYSGQVGSTPLYIALAYRRFDCFRELLLAGANPDIACGHSTAMPLYYQALKRDLDPEYICLLYECGAELSRQDELVNQVLRNTGLTCAAFVCQQLGEPRSLQSACRLCVRRALGRTRFSSIGLLPLPSALKAYLRHEH